MLVTGGPSFAYLPDADFFGRDSFTYTVSDGRAETSALVSIDVESVNDLPVITAIQGDGELKARSPGGFSYTDVDGPIPEVTVTQRRHRTVMLDSADYVIRAPYSSAARYLKLGSKQATAGQGGTVKAASTQTIDLAPFLPACCPE